MAFHIKNAETDALARKVAALKKVGLTEAVHAALSHELEREQAKPSLAGDVASWTPILARRGPWASALSKAGRQSCCVSSSH